MSDWNFWHFTEISMIKKQKYAWKKKTTTILNWIWSGFAQFSHTGTLADASMELGRIKMGFVRVLSFHEIIICL